MIFILTSPNVASSETLTLVDGGLSGQNVPIWPFIQNHRTVDVLIASDNSANTDFNWPNGTELHQTYLNAIDAGLTRMPYIPTAETFVEQGLNTRAQFFGCNDTDTIFIVYLPNTDYVFASNQSTLKLQYTVEETAGMIDNGVAIATQNGTENWPFCLACGIMNAAEQLPEGCDECFAEYCYYQ
jgi:lysophospholipase